MVRLFEKIKYLRKKELSMPIYEYQCKNCNYVFEELVFTSEDKSIKCPQCGGNEIKRLLSATRLAGKTSSGSCSVGDRKGFS